MVISTCTVHARSMCVDKQIPSKCGCLQALSTQGSWANSTNPFQSSSSSSAPWDASEVAPRDGAVCRRTKQRRRGSVEARIGPGPTWNHLSERSWTTWLQVISRPGPGLAVGSGPSSEITWLWVIRRLTGGPTWWKGTSGRAPG